MRLRMAVYALCLVTVGCGKGDDEGKKNNPKAGDPSKNVSKPSENISKPSAFDQDIDRICNAERLSGATDLPKGHKRAMTVTMWLAKNLETAKGRRFLGLTSKLVDPKKKAEALAAQAEKSGVGDCPLVRLWSGPKPAGPTTEP